MHLVYIDDSKDAGRVCFSAIIIPADLWHDALEHMIGMRRQMNQSDGIYMTKELHATDWLAGRGNVGKGQVPKAARARLFEFVLCAIAMLPGVQIINASGGKNSEMTLFERLLNRIDNNMRYAGSRCILISDAGKSYDALARRMRRHNFIPSRFGQWPDGTQAANMPVRRILEDIWYKDSAASFFIQAADFCAFSLLRFESPTERYKRAGLERAFLHLDRALVKKAYSLDWRRLGIIRA